jgi:hypothetical protein
MTNVMTPGIRVRGMGQLAPKAWTVGSARVSIADLGVYQHRNAAVAAHADVPTTSSNFQTITSAKPAPPPRQAHR